MALLDTGDPQTRATETRLAEQATGALHELLRGFQAADAAAGGRLLGELARTDPQHVHGGLLTVLLRLVFLLYAEDRGLMPGDAPYAEHDAVSALYRRLCVDAGECADSLDQRHGAWASLLSLFRLIYTGGGPARPRLPARLGSLFHPGDAGQGYPFLEGRPRVGSWRPGERLEVPRVSDGVVWRVLDKLRVVDGEPVSYRALEVEQIGSIYEAMIGHTLARAQGPSVVPRPGHVVELAEILSKKPGDRAALLGRRAGCELSGRALAALRGAETPEAVAAALGRKIVPPGSLLLLPGEERRRSGSHYTPRALTGPIVETTLRPVLAALGERPTPAQILALKICDPAMGCGAFLLETCRQLGAHLARAWALHGETPPLPPDDEPLLHARRLVAQRCLYGVDRNPLAVELARLSLWLITRASDQPFTFLDHALRHGDSLVGLSRAQIDEFRSDDRRQERREDGGQAYERQGALRLRGDAIVHAFFEAGERGRAREHRRAALRLVADAAGRGDEQATATLRALGEQLRARSVVPFHWEIELPEVFGRDNPGFDGVVGNPPFMGGIRISGATSPEYLAYLTSACPQTGGQADLVAYFFRRSYALLRHGGALGLLATHTISRGDTRKASLQPIVRAGGKIYAALRRVPWKGAASVLSSVVWIVKGDPPQPCVLDGEPCAAISAFLFPHGGSEDPHPLRANAGRAFKGHEPYGDGFVFEDGNPKANPLSALTTLRADPRNRERIFPYLGGEELNASPSQTPSRHIIYFEEMTLEQAERWPELLAIVRARVKAERATKAADVARWPWWQYWRSRPELRRACAGLSRVLALADTSKHLSLAFVPTTYILNKTLVIVALDDDASFAVLQSRVHEVWARCFGSSLEDRLRYTASDCFETFPFPSGWQRDGALVQVGRRYHERRADLMLRGGEGLTEIYNRFHAPDELSADIAELRELHAAIDRAVLDAYGWRDLAGRAACEFRLDYEDDEPRARSRMRPWRYRWPQGFRDEVLARLLELNRQRAEQERLTAPLPDIGRRARRAG